MKKENVKNENSNEEELNMEDKLMKGLNKINLMLDIFIAIMIVTVIVNIITIDEQVKIVKTSNEIVSSSEDDNLNLQEIFKGISLILVVSGSISLPFSLKKIINNSIKSKTPFTEKNIKLLKAVNMDISLIIVFSNVLFTIPGMCSLLIIVFVNSLIKYGCELQKEHDETI